MTYLLTLPRIFSSPCVTKTSLYSFRTHVLSKSSHISRKRTLFLTFLRLSLLRNVKYYHASVLLLEELCVFFTNRKLLKTEYKDGFNLTTFKM
jgi:hypothetical protein